MLLACWSVQAQTINNSKPSDPSLIKGKGTLSFKMNGTTMQSHPQQTKCWTSANVPMAMLWAKGQGVSISLQVTQVEGRGIYRIDRDSVGTVNFTIGNKSYWVRNPGAGNYLTIQITQMKEVYNLKLLSGTFEGVLEDSSGNKIRITEGRFTSEDI